MWQYFVDPILKAPTLGCMAMCLACSLVGVIIFVRKEALLGETLSHAAYPGIMLAALLNLVPFLKLPFTAYILIGAAVFSYLAVKLLDFCKNRLNMHPDSSLSFVLTGFFGLGLCIASALQYTHSQLYRQALVFLFGQAATITDSHMYFSIALALVMSLALFVFYLPIQTALLDPVFAKTKGISIPWINRLIYIMMIASIVIGIRSIGLFLLSGMFIAPAIAARQWTHRLSYVFILSGCIGLLSGFLGIYTSVEWSIAFSKPGHSLSFASGPMILLTACAFTLLSLLFAPKQGWIARGCKILRFRFKCAQENILKSLWHFSQKEERVQEKKVWDYQNLPFYAAFFFKYYLQAKGEVQSAQSHLSLTTKGIKKAQNIVRLHRLWELYLVHIGVGKEKVHHNAEEMEHIITPSIEQKLLKIMKHPKKDPHNQPIPYAARSPYV